jgi:hypothetical protein
MLPVFNYNSRSFTTLAVILLAILGYYAFNESSSQNIQTPNSTVGARYVMEVDPGNADKTLWEKFILFVFKSEIDQKIEQNTQVKSLPEPYPKITKNNYVSKTGDKVLVIYYATNPLPPFIPSPEEVIIGNNNLPKSVDKMLSGLKVGEKREFKSGDINYHIELIGIVEPTNDKPQK